MILDYLNNYLRKIDDFDIFLNRLDCWHKYKVVASNIYKLKALKIGFGVLLKIKKSFLKEKVYFIKSSLIVANVFGDIFKIKDYIIFDILSTLI